MLILIFGAMFWHQVEIRIGTDPNGLVSPGVPGADGLAPRAESRG